MPIHDARPIAGNSWSRPSAPIGRLPARFGAPAAWGLALAPFVCLTAIFFIAPLANFLGRYGFHGGTWRAVIGSSGERTILVRTLVIAVEVTLISGVLAYFYVAALLRTRGVVRAMLIFAAVVPFFTSILVRSYAWIVVLGSDGPLRRALNWILGGDRAPQFLYNRTGVLIGMVHVLLPLFVLPLYAVMREIPTDLHRAARTLGANRVEAFLRVDLPLSAAGAAAGGVLVFITALGFFVTPSLLGGFGDTMVAQLIDQQLQESVDLNAAAVLAILLIIAVLLLIFVFRLAYPLELLFVQRFDADKSTHSRRVSMLRFLEGRRRLAMTNVLSRMPWTGLSTVVAGLTALYFLLPLLVVVPVSFSGDAYLHFPSNSYSLRWYRSVIGDPSWRHAALNSVVTGLAATALVASVGLLLSFALVRARMSTRLKGFVVLIAVLPVVVPVIVLAIASFVWFLRLHIAASTPALAASHALLGLPFLLVVVTAALRDLDPAIERASRSLGASARATLRLVTLPLLRAAILVGLFFAFLQSWDELLIARDVTNDATATLPVKLWAGANQEISPALAVVSTVGLAVTLALVGSSFLVRRKEV